MKTNEKFRQGLPIKLTLDDYNWSYTDQIASYQVHYILVRLIKTPNKRLVPAATFFAGLHAEMRATYTIAQQYILVQTELAR